jgi:hypothetical protein
MSRFKKFFLSFSATFSTFLIKLIGPSISFSCFRLFFPNKLAWLLQVRPRLVRYTPVGTRVCCYWSSQISFLHPGTVTAVAESPQQLVTVQLDDGDERVVHVDSVRLLPGDYPPVVETGGKMIQPLVAVGTVENSTRTSLTVQVQPL